MKTWEELKNLSRATATEDDHIDMIKQPWIWPKYPILPLVHKDGRMGFLHSQVENVVVIGCFFIALKNIGNNKMEVYKKPEEIVAAGWMVD